VVGIDSVIYYMITDPASAQYKIESVVSAIEQLVVTTLRNVVGGMLLEDALTGRDTINERLATVLDEATGKWGVKVNRVEVRGIEPPATIRDAMEQAMRADRGKRAAILTAEGARQSAVLNAEGEKSAVVLNAEADRTATVMRAEADREALLLRAEGEAKAIAVVVDAIKQAGIDETVLAYQRQQLIPRIAEGDANKIWFVPTDMAGALGQATQALGLSAPPDSATAPAPAPAPSGPVRRVRSAGKGAQPETPSDRR
jgi:regulator of protease activity HflC (stomatin/prohibitin superfamily)